MGIVTRVAMLLAVASAAVADTPPSIPRITSIQYSGSGCPNNADQSGDFNSPTFTYHRFTTSYPGTDGTTNCEVHVQSSGGSSGWQVALSDIYVTGHVTLDPNTRLDYYTTVYYSQAAADTV